MNQETHESREIGRVLLLKHKIDRRDHERKADCVVPFDRLIFKKEEYKYGEYDKRYCFLKYL